MPATMGADTEVPVWLSVQRCRRSVVTCRERSCSPQRCSRCGHYPTEHSRFIEMLPGRSQACGYPTPAVAAMP